MTGRRRWQRFRLIAWNPVNHLGKPPPERWVCVSKIQLFSRSIINCILFAHIFAYRRGREKSRGKTWLEIFECVVYAHRNGPRLFNPVHVIELPQLASVWLSPYILSAAIRLAFCISVLGCFMSRCFRWTFFAPMGEKRRFLPGKRTEIQPSLGTEGAPRQANFRSGI